MASLHAYIPPCVREGATGLRPGEWIALEYRTLVELRVRTSRFGPVACVSAGSPAALRFGAVDVLVTGGSGTFGSKLVPLLLERGHRVRVLTRREHAPLPPGVEVVRGDLRTGVGVARAAAGADAVVHAASDTAHRGHDDLVMTERLLAEARTSHLIFVSIVGIDRIPFSYYERKLACERAIERSGTPFTIFRSTQFHEFLELTLRRVERWPIAFLPLAWRFQPTAAKEAAARATRLLDDGPAGRSDFGGPEVLTGKEVVDLWRRKCGRLRVVFGVPLPGAVSRGFRKGWNTVPERAEGRQTWDEYVRDLE